jgi:hypothetical protein
MLGKYKIARSPVSEWASGLVKSGRNDTQKSGRNEIRSLSPLSLSLPSPQEAQPHTAAPSPARPLALGGGISRFCKQNGKTLPKSLAQINKL